MKTLLAAVFTFMLCIYNGYALKCYSCGPAMSLEECTKNMTQLTCTAAAGLDRCVDYMASGKSAGKEVKIYLRSCFASLSCGNADQYCQAYGSQLADAKCEINCCSGDLCNNKKAPGNDGKAPGNDPQSNAGVQATMASVILMVASASALFPFIH